MDFSALSLVRPKAEPSDKDIDDALERMAGEQKRSEPIKGKRKSKKGDVLVLDFTGYIEGEAFGGSAEGQQLELARTYPSPVSRINWSALKRVRR